MSRAVILSAVRTPVVIADCASGERLFHPGIWGRTGRICAAACSSTCRLATISGDGRDMSRHMPPPETMCSPGGAGPVWTPAIASSNACRLRLDSFDCMMDSR